MLITLSKSAWYCCY